MGIAAKPYFLRAARKRKGGDPSALSLITNLIWWWKLDEASGTRVDSVTATANDLTDNNTVTNAAGIAGQAGQFTLANSEYLSRADNASLSCGDIDFSWACWVYADSLPATVGPIVTKDMSGGGLREYSLIWAGSAANRFRFTAFVAVDSGQIVNADTFGAPSTGTWYFLVVWHDATANTVNIQVNDGTADSTATAGALQAESTATFAIGSRAINGFTEFWNGRIDEVGFWKRTLTVAERTYLYNAGAGRTWSGGLIV